jgi:hypothetical protein
MGDRRDPYRIVHIGVVDRVREPAKPVLPRAQGSCRGEGVGGASDALDGRFELPAEFAAEAGTLALVILDRGSNLRLGLGVDDQRLHG